MTGRIDANGNYADLRSNQESLDFNAWSHVVPTTTGRVLYYSWVTGEAVLGEIDTQGAYTTGPLLQLASYWTYIVPVP